MLDPFLCGNYALIWSGTLKIDKLDRLWLDVSGNWEGYAMAIVKIDFSKLLGFRLVSQGDLSGAMSGAKTGDKPGVKVGLKPTGIEGEVRGALIGGKIGAKEGSKPPQIG
jgi:hypothetical protein